MGTIIKIIHNFIYSGFLEEEYKFNFSLAVALNLKT